MNQSRQKSWTEGFIAYRNTRKLYTIRELTNLDIEVIHKIE